MHCGLCKAEAVLVNHGHDIGQYYYCRACKLEQKEWEARAKPQLEAKVKEPSKCKHPSYEICDACFPVIPQNFWFTTAWVKGAGGPKTIKARRTDTSKYNDCYFCGVPAGFVCERDCVNGEKLYD